MPDGSKFSRCVVEALVTRNALTLHRSPDDLHRFAPKLARELPLIALELGWITPDGDPDVDRAQAYLLNEYRIEVSKAVTTRFAAPLRQADSSARTGSSLAALRAGQ